MGPGTVRFRLPRPGRRPLGQLLIESGALSVSDRARALALQTREDARLGDILLAHGLIDRDRLYAAIARQFDTELADFRTTPPDIRLIEALGAERCLAEGCLPWIRRDGAVLVATARPEQFATARPGLEKDLGRIEMVITSETELHEAVLTRHPRALAARAETRVAAADSCRSWPSRALPGTFMALVGVLLTCAVLAPRPTFLVLAGWAIATLIASSLLKLAAAFSRISDKRHGARTDPEGAPIIARLPAVSILVPLYKEREVAARLIGRLARIDYPRELLDICLVVEADDQITIDAIEASQLPAHIRQIVVPHGELKTKPRALNYALEFCRGSIVGVYDAEDAPAPDQIHRVVRRFHERGPDVACLQGVLDFYNARTNWLSRCFTIEYATWFRVILPGLARLGLVVPLGGTTLFFRRAVLEELGGWDAHNVTEDADLGVRLARRGYRTELIDSVTGEEANCHFWPWIKQRSRWLKGYAVTWAVHMRRPGLLWRELGPWRFFGIQLLFLGTISQFLLAPLLWSFWLVPLGLPHPAAGLASGAYLWALAAIFLGSELITIAVGIYAVRGAKHRFLIPWVPTLHLYFPMAALASYKGVFELMSRPFYWDKTSHGLYDQQSQDAD